MGERLRRMCTAEAAAGRERLRQWLVAAGQIEQAVRDGGAASPEAAAVTDVAADLFLDSLAGGVVETGALVAALERVRWPGAVAEVRIPEGYAWYGLYPESHAAAAAGWAAGRRGQRVLVVGLLSIGTSLGAVVAAALWRAGVVVTDRLALRPEGHPFARQVTLPAEIEAGDAVLVVDEGPGLSGSSMAGVAEALVSRGVRADAITFLPGHDHGPGSEANAAVRRWWTPARCVTAPAPQLVEPTAERDWIFGGLAAVNAELETLAEVKRARQCRLAAAGVALPSPALRHGWIAITRQGVALRRQELSPALVQDTLAPYVARAAGASDAAAIAGGVQRIAAALAPHGLKHGVAAQVLPACRALPMAGDGRMAPEEWRRLADGRVLKHDATGSDCAHDWAGAQCVLWDVAGAMVEWRMNAAQRSLLRDCLRERDGIAADPRALCFHLAGYAALGLARAEHGGDREVARHRACELREALRWLG